MNGRGESLRPAISARHGVDDRLPRRDEALVPVDRWTVRNQNGSSWTTWLISEVHGEPGARERRRTRALRSAPVAGRCRSTPRRASAGSDGETGDARPGRESAGEPGDAPTASSARRTSHADHGEEEQRLAVRRREEVRRREREQQDDRPPRLVVSCRARRACRGTTPHPRTRATRPPARTRRGCGRRTDERHGGGEEGEEDDEQRVVADARLPRRGIRRDGSAGTSRPWRCAGSAGVPRRPHAMPAAPTAGRRGRRPRPCRATWSTTRMTRHSRTRSRRAGRLGGSRGPTTRDDRTGRFRALSPGAHSLDPCECWGSTPA